MPDVSHLLWGLLAIFILVFANGFFVAAEFALVTVRKTRIDQLISEGHRRARVVRRALTDPESYIAATQLGITMASLALGWVGEPALATFLESALEGIVGEAAAATAHTIAIAVAFTIITALHIVLGELAPKTVALQHPEQTALIVAGPTEVFMRVFWPFISLLNGMGRAVVRLAGLKPPSGHSLVHSEEELKMLVTASQEAGVLEEDEEQMLHRVFGFADLTAGHVMVPRTEMVAIPEDA
ncbi:MAG TPA: hemolysin family protein, partial [Vicinamibacterales bacterium]|nr:hemolysin family protein [Vicinamibacterales bacterium]